MIELIASKEGKHWKILMTISEWRNFKKKPGFTYLAYQIGFSQYKLE